MKKCEKKRRPMVFLGYASKNSMWKFGCYIKRKNGGYEWRDYESQDAKFCENILVSDVEFLKPGNDVALVKTDSLLERLERGRSCEDQVPEGGQPLCPAEATATCPISRRESDHSSQTAGVENRKRHIDADSASSVSQWCLRKCQRKDEKLILVSTKERKTMSMV